MQIIVYKYANKSLFIDSISERNGEKTVIHFPENIKGKCHFGKQILKIVDGRSIIDFPLSRGMYPLWIEGYEERIGGEGLIYKDGKFHRAVTEELSSALYEIARLRDTVTTLTEEVNKLSQAVFHTVIF